MLTDSEIVPTPSQHRKLWELREEIKVRFPRAEVKKWTAFQIEAPHVHEGTLIVLVTLGGRDDDADPAAFLLRQHLIYTITPKGGKERMTPEGLFGRPLSRRPPAHN